MEATGPMDLSPATCAEPIELRDDHLAQALSLSQQLAWPYRLEDWAFAHRLGRGFAVELDARLVGTALWWPYGDDYGSAGMIIVAPDAQRRGIGAALMASLLADAAGRSVILNSTDEGRALYARLGFRAYGAVHQHQAMLGRAPEMPAGSTATIRDFAAADLPAIRAIDGAGAGMIRDPLIDALFAIGEVVVAERDGRVVGYACVRDWGRGVVIGPVVAAGDQDARALIAALARRRVGARGGNLRAFQSVARLIHTKDDCHAGHPSAAARRRGADADVDRNPGAAARHR
jgi:GNAT superfamily N-acetyltransferase